MSQKPETVFRAHCMKRLKAIPGTWWESIQQRTIKGSPDVIGCLLGLFIGLEFKSDEGRLSAIQQEKLKSIARAGGLGFEVSPSTWPGILELLLELHKKMEEDNALAEGAQGVTH